MYSSDNVLEFAKRASRAPKVFIEQRLSVEDNEDITYYVYTMLEEGRKVSGEDIDDLVIIPDERPIIVGDFNCTDKSIGVLKVAQAIIKDQDLKDKANLPSLKTPVWKYKDHAHTLQSVAKH